MKLDRRLNLIVVLAVVAICASCVKAPASYTPKVAAQFYATQTIHYLDDVRDFADAGNKTTPPVVSDAALHVVVDWHESIAKVLHAAPEGWRAAALAGLDELRAKLPAADVAHFKPVIDAAKTYIQES